jgi:hypothetical protein
VADDTYRVCSSCKKPIAFQATYFACSVSTCNRKRTALYFCSVPCWDVHLPEARHREAWAEERRAPTRAEAEREEAATPTATATATATATVTVTEAPTEVLVVVSKLKSYVRAATGMNTSDGCIDVLSDHLRRLCDAAARVAARDGRRTVMDRDFNVVLADWND